MKTFTQKTIGLLALLFAVSSIINAQDINSPSLIDFTISDTQINLFDGEGDVSFDIYAEDDLSGIHEVILTLRYDQYVYTYTNNSCNEELNCLSEFNIDFTNWNPGEYTVDNIRILDLAGNVNQLNINDLQSLGHDVFFNVSLIGLSGCTDALAINYNAEANTDDGSCVAVVNGCTDALAINHNTEANTDDGSCEAVVEGCMDETAFNYNAAANTDDGSCVAVVNGCMDSSMSNYNSEANTDDGSCVSWEELANNLQSELDNVVLEDGVSQEDVDAVQSELDAANEALDAAMANQEDGFSQADVDAAYADGVASVEVPECEEVATQNIPLDLPQGWSMFGYTCLESLDVVGAFSGVSDNIEIVKDEWGLAYLPAWGFSAFSNLEFGEGYQIKMIEGVGGFQFCSTITPEDGITQADLVALAESYEDWIAPVYGCTDTLACNFDLLVNNDDGSCVYAQYGYDCGGDVFFQIGDLHAGGIVFQFNEDGTGLVADLQDLGELDWWDALDAAEGATSQGYDDWYLPSMEELELMYNTIGNGGPEGNIGGFGENQQVYWSSSENIWGVLNVDFNNGFPNSLSTRSILSVRVIRAF